MSAVHTIPTPIDTPATSPTSTSPDRQGAGLPSSSSSPTLPALTPDQDHLFEALAKGQTSPSELAATLNLPVRHILNLLATPEITFHLQVLENAIDYLARHTTRLRHNLAFKSLETALDAAASKDNPAEIRRIATLLLKPTPPLPDPEAEHAERPERITKHRRAVKEDARSEQKDAEYAALAKSMVMRAHAPQPVRQQPSAPDTRLGRKPGLVPPSVTNQPAAPASPTSPAPQTISHSTTAQPRAA